MAELTKEEAQELHDRLSCEGVVMWTVTESPRDFPDNYVARPILVAGGRLRQRMEYLLGDSIAELRAQLPVRVTRLPRAMDDDAVIIEIWF
jgi:hypothetical protein